MNELFANILQRTSDITEKKPELKLKGEHVCRETKVVFAALFTFTAENRSGERSWHPANFVYWPLTDVEPKLNPDRTTKMTK